MPGGTPVTTAPRSSGGNDIAHLFKDRKFQLAAGGVVVVGGLVWFMRRWSGAAPSSDSTAGAGGSRGYVSQGGANTTGTDIASFLGSWGAGQNAAFQQYLDQLKNGTAPAGATLGQISGFKDNSPGQWTNSVQLAWTPVSGATGGYQIRDYLHPDRTWNVPAGWDKYQIQDLLHNGSYFWQIRPIGSDGTMGDWTDYISTRTKN